MINLTPFPSFHLSGVALKSCTAFIQFLKEEKDEESTGEDEN